MDFMQYRRILLLIDVSVLLYAPDASLAYSGHSIIVIFTKILNEI